MEHPKTAEDRGLLIGMIIALTAMVIALVLAFVLAPSPASAETPAERCKRETTAYNNAWKRAWAQANPDKNPSNAPNPPVPYKCGGSNDGPAPTTTTPEETPKETVTPTTTSSPKSSSSEGPNMNAPTERREIEHPGPGQPTIGDGVTTNSGSGDNRSNYGRKDASRSPLLCPPGYSQVGGVVPGPPYEAIECYRIVSVEENQSGEIDADPPLRRTNCTSDPLDVTFSRESSVQVGRQVTRSESKTESNEFSVGTEVSSGDALKILSDVKTTAEATHSQSTTISNEDTRSMQKTINVSSSDSPVVKPGEMVVGTPTYTRIRYQHAYVYRMFGTYDPANTSYTSGQVLNPDGGLRWQSWPANCG